MFELSDELDDLDYQREIDRLMNELIKRFSEPLPDEDTELFNNQK